MLVTNITEGKDGGGASAGPRDACFGLGPVSPSHSSSGFRQSKGSSQDEFPFRAQCTVITSEMRKGNRRRGCGRLPAASGPVDALDCLP